MFCIIYGLFLFLYLFLSFWHKSVFTNLLMFADWQTWGTWFVLSLKGHNLLGFKACSYFTPRTAEFPPELWGQFRKPVFIWLSWSMCMWEPKPSWCFNCVASLRAKRQRGRKEAPHAHKDRKGRLYGKELPDLMLAAENKDHDNSALRKGSRCTRSEAAALQIRERLLAVEGHAAMMAMNCVCSMCLLSRHSDINHHNNPQ